MSNGFVSKMRDDVPIRGKPRTLDKTIVNGLMMLEERNEERIIMELRDFDPSEAPALSQQ